MRSNPSLSWVFRLASLAVVPAALAATLPACDEVGEALDANNSSQPGEADGAVVELATVPQRVANVAADAEQVFIVAENGDILSRPAGGTAAPARIGGYTRAEAYGNHAAALLDAAHLYILDGKTVQRMARAGGPVEKLADAAPAGLAQTADAVFAVSSDKKRILRIDKTTKAISDLAAGFGRAMDIAGADDRVVVADQELETITAVSTKDGAKVELARNQSRPRYIGVGPDHVYWFNGSLSDANKSVEDRIMRVKKDGAGAPEAVAPINDVFFGPIAADARFVYLGRRGGGLHRAPAGGGTSTKYVNAAVIDFVLRDGGLLALENNGERFSESEKNKPNRLLSVPK